jgi:hypothetical protein
VRRDSLLGDRQGLPPLFARRTSGRGVTRRGIRREVDMARKSDGQIQPFREGMVANDNRPPASRRGESETTGTKAGRTPPSPGMRNLVTLVIVLAGIGMLYWLVTSFMDWNKMQTCLSYGGHNCTPTTQLNDR